ncbi:hypothetical protein C7B79_00605 [Chroococcidiopsis cubana CCALA 043]|nr:hypothetical protein C7B79_00605 [Chroococcidiopsis cubana CCALA 043]
MDSQDFRHLLLVSLSEAAGGTFLRLLARQSAAQFSAVALLASATVFLSTLLPRFFSLSFRLG